MKWEGFKIKEYAKDKKLSIQNLANEVGVSRQTVNDWINGQVPKGNHLLLLCKFFNTNPNDFFTNNIEKLISVPVHRQRMNSKITKSTQRSAISISKEYLNIFRNEKKSEILPVIRTQEIDLNNARNIAHELRAMTGISNDIPIDYKHTFKLSEKLGINVIFRDFPASIKSYAFYTKIYNHRVVFINNATNILDLIFPLLHESVHAIRDELNVDSEYENNEENFCDLVANFIQFPEPYVKMVYNTIKEFNKPLQVITLKQFASSYNHSLYGIVKAIKINYTEFKLNVGGADANLRKKFPTIKEIIYNGEDVRNFIQNLKSLSKNFFEIVLHQIDIISNRKLAEILGINNLLDSKEIKSELLKELSLSES